VATHKTNQLDINLSQVKDLAVREALNSIVNFVGGLAKAVRTGGEVKGTTVSNALGSAGFDKDGNLFAKTLEIGSGGAFKVAIFTGELSASGGQTLTLADEARILGVLGWTQISAGSEWNVMFPVVTGSEGIYFNTTAASTSNSVRFVNSDAVNANQYRVVIFYADR
jgi:hypothetical protein